MTYFPETDADQTWLEPDRVKRYHLNFPFYPFRTLCPRDMQFAFKAIHEFDPTSPIFPANTQINFVFQKRKNRNFLLNMLSYNLPSNLGSTANVLTAAQQTAATQFPLRVGNAEVNHVISRVDISIRDMYLQVKINCYTQLINSYLHMLQRKMKKNVCFNDVITVIEEPLELAEDLYKSRKSNWTQKQLDKIRMERLLVPILDKNHRKKIYNKYFFNV
jgi:hypothetical protein